MAKPTLGLSMIVKNGGGTLRRCLESVRGVVDEIVVADTGSTDNTLEVLREFGAICSSIPWQNDFAKARNASLDLSTTDWVLWLDADEELDHEARLKNLLASARSQIGGFIAPVRDYLPARHGSVNGNRAIANDGRCESAKNAPAYAERPAVKLFRRDPKIRFQGCVHEVIAPQVVAAGFKLAKSNYTIHHLGFLQTGDPVGKAEFYLALLRKKVEQQPNNPMAWLELARQLHEPFHKNEEALQSIARCLALEPRMPAATLLAGLANLELGRERDALVVLDLYNGDELAAEREHCRGDACHNLGLLPEAKTAYSKSLKLVGHDPQLESKLGYVEVKLGEKASGLARMEKALAALPLGAELHERLIKAYMAAGMLPEAANAAETFARTLVHPKTILRAVAIRAHLKQTQQAQSLILRGLEFFPESPELKSAQAELSRVSS